MRPAVVVVLLVISATSLRSESKTELELRLKLDAATQALASEHSVRIKCEQTLTEAVKQRAIVASLLSKQIAISLESGASLERTSKSLDETKQSLEYARKQLAYATDVSSHNTELLKSIEAYVGSQTMILIIGISIILLLIQAGFYFIMKATSARYKKEVSETIEHLKTDLTLAREGQRASTEAVAAIVNHKDETTKNGS